jgi:Na+-transporting NADH:ubiquinone oxidoreductase subunit A
VLREGRERELFGWIVAGKDKYSAMNIYTSSRDRSSGRFTSTAASPTGISAPVALQT